MLNLSKEEKVLAELFEIVLEVVDNPKDRRRKSRISKNYHISRNVLTPEKLPRTNQVTFFRLMIALSQEAEMKEFNDMLEKMKYLTLEVAEMEDGTPEAIIKAHEGSIIGRQKAKSIKKDKKK